MTGNSRTRSVHSAVFFPCCLKGCRGQLPAIPCKFFGSIHEESLFQGIPFFPYCLRPGRKILQNSLVQFFMLPPQGSGIKASCAGGSQVREHRVFEPDGLSDLLGHERANGLGGVPEQPVPRMGAQPVAEEMPVQAIVPLPMDSGDRSVFPFPCIFLKPFCASIL